MATFSTLNPTTIGEPTKKSDYDKVFNNTLNLSTFLGDRDLTDHGVLIGSGTAAITALATMGDGELVIGNDGADPVIASLSSSTGIGITNAAGSITIAWTPAASTINQSLLKTTVGSVSDVNGANAYFNHTLPGGEYGFYPQLKAQTINELSAMICSSGIGSTGAYITNIAMKTSTWGVGHTIWAQQRYVTASGEIFWIYLLRDKTTKKINQAWQGPDHPCFGNGGKPLLVPHPFPGYDSNTQEIVVITPTTEELQEFYLRCEELAEDKSNRDLLEVILDDYEIDESSHPKWPTKEVTVGLPSKWNEAWHTGEAVTPIKKVIPKPEAILHKTLKPKNGKTL